MKNNKYLWNGFAISFFLLTVSWKLTNASLWFDETVEFFYSRIALSNMYGKIVNTFQPPLYNFILHFWLKISENEWWFRLSGIMFGFIGSIGLYKTIEKMSGFKAACVGMVFYATSYSMVYYLQEASEYALLLGTVSWIPCFFINLLKNTKSSALNINLFVISCVLAVYSQYGAAFVVISAYVVLLGEFIQKRYFKKSMILCCAGLCAGIFAGFPLIYFFLLPQMKAQGTNTGNIQQITFDTNILYDLWECFCKVIQWIFLGETEITLDIVIKICLSLCVILIGYQIMISKDHIYQMLVTVFVLSFVLYYIAVKLGFYATNSYTNDNFGNRYNLFLGPWFLMIIIVTIEKYLSCYYQNEHIIIPLKYVMYLCGTFFAFGIILFGYNYIRIYNNWSKEDSRGVVDAWYSFEGYESHTLVYYGNEYGFRYYFEHDERYSHQYSENIIYQPWSRGISETDFEQFLSEKYVSGIPTEIYFTASHIKEDLTSMLNVFSNKGYIIDNLWQGTDACLYYIHY